MGAFDQAMANGQKKIGTQSRKHCDWAYIEIRVLSLDGDCDLQWYSYRHLAYLDLAQTVCTSRASDRMST